MSRLRKCGISLGLLFFYKFNYIKSGKCFAVFLVETRQKMTNQKKLKIKRAYLIINSNLYAITFFKGTVEFGLIYKIIFFF